MIPTPSHPLLITYSIVDQRRTINPMGFYGSNANTIQARLPVKLIAFLKHQVLPILDSTICWPVVFTIQYQFGCRAYDSVQWWPVCCSKGNSCRFFVHHCSVHHALVLSVGQYLHIIKRSCNFLIARLFILLNVRTSM